MCSDGIEFFFFLLLSLSLSFLSHLRCSIVTKGRSILLPIGMSTSWLVFEVSQQKWKNIRACVSTQVLFNKRRWFVSTLCNIMIKKGKKMGRCCDTLVSCCDFQHQKYAVRIQSMAILIYCHRLWKVQLNSTVNPSAPTIAWPRVRIPSTTNIIFNLYYNCDVNRTIINKKRPELGILFEKRRLVNGLLLRSTSKYYY